MSGPLPTVMAREAAEAPAAVHRLIAANEAACRDLGARLRKTPPHFVVTCARGSSDAAATYVKYLIEIQLGSIVASVGPSVSSIYGGKPRMREALFLAISQSGRSPDLLTLAEAARAQGALTVALVNDTKSPLAGICEVVLPLNAWPERSVAATKSYIAALAASLQFVAHWSGDPGLHEAVKRLPADLAEALQRDWLPAAPLIEHSRGLYVIGRGPGFGAALEAALKLKETCGIHGEALSAAELMHGPLTLAGTDFPVILFSQRDAALASLREIATGLVARGVPVIAAGPAAASGSLALPGAADLHPFAQPIALVQSFYPLVEAIARARGRDPDSPPHLKKVTETH
jgi:glucosamine--fructose-6-phosphate aminotransferase (isomerizing)